MAKWKRWAIVLAVLMAATGGAVAYRYLGWMWFAGRTSALGVNLARPDAWIRTHKLSELPRDLLKVPIARDVLAEDFVFYYEQNGDRLGLKGSLRRIAYEHQLAWNDRLLEAILAAPAEVALWRDQRNRIEHFAIVFNRNAFGTVLQEAATLALKDSQLTKAATMTVNGDTVDIFALDYAPQRTLLIAVHGDRVVVFSNPGLLLGGERKISVSAGRVLARLLDRSPAEQAVWSQYFGVDAEEKLHRVVVTTHFLSFGYQHFFPSLEALRFDFSKQGQWSTQVLLDGTKLAGTGLKNAALWKAVPTDPAACAFMPVDWKRADSVAGAVPAVDKVAAPVLLAQLEGTAAVCWYTDSQLQSPLFIGTLKADAKLEPADWLQSAFSWAMNGEVAEVEALAKDGTRVFGSSVEAPFAPKSGDSAGAYTPTLAIKGRQLWFSPDRALVKRALDTAARRYPNLGDVLADDAATLGVLVPRQLARMAQAEALAVLPREQEVHFRDAAEKLLLPRLAKLGRYPAYRLALRTAANPQLPQTRGWLPVEWQTLRSTEVPQ